MISMTGFGRGTAGDDDIELSVEAASVNRRNFEIMISLPREWNALERQIAEIARQIVLRGKLNISVRVLRLPAGSGFDWDDDAVARTLDKLAELARKRGVRHELTPDLLFRVASQHATGAEMPDAETVWPIAEEALQIALNELQEMRRREGRHLAVDIEQRGEFLQNVRDEIEKLAVGAVPDYRNALMQRLRSAGLEIDLNDERVLKEIAIFADRADISEEITRLGSHLHQLRDSVKAKGLIGRKLEFLLQEVNREFNTVGAKANNIEISKRVIEAKNEIERIREQVQNVQ